MDGLLTEVYRSEIDGAVGPRGRGSVRVSGDRRGHFMSRAVPVSVKATVAYPSAHRSSHGNERHPVLIQTAAEPRFYHFFDPVAQ